MMQETYEEAQHAITVLKSAVRSVVEQFDHQGITNAQLGRLLGIYSGHVEHEGHISRTLLAMLEGEGVVRQDKTTKKWFMNSANIPVDDPVS